MGLLDETPTDAPIQEVPETHSRQRIPAVPHFTVEGVGQLVGQADHVPADITQRLPPQHLVQGVEMPIPIAQSETMLEPASTNHDVHVAQAQGVIGHVSSLRQPNRARQPPAEQVTQEVPENHINHRGGS